MELELWGIHSPFYLRFPLRPSGYALLLFDILGLILLFLVYRRFQREPENPNRKKGLWFTLLILLAPLAAELFAIRLPAQAVLSSIPIEYRGPMFSLLGCIPWMLAAGTLGVREAVLVGFITGLARGGWETFSIFTPFHMALQAGLVAVLLRQNYREWPGQIARHPFIAGMIAIFGYTFLRSLEFFFYSTGDMYDVLNYTLSSAPFILIATGFEVGIAGQRFPLGLQKLQIKMSDYLKSTPKTADYDR